MDTEQFMPGYVPSTRTPSDYIKGVNSPLGSVPEFQGFDWRTVRPTLDLQLKNGFESSGCVSWAAVQTCEELLNAQIKLGLMPKANIDLLNQNGYVVNGLVVFSKAYIWNLSGTQEGVGNSFPNVAKAITTYGLIPESAFPFNPAAGAKWADVFIQPTNAMKSIGAQFLKHFNIGYHYLTGAQNFTQDLNDGPVQIAIPVCAGYNTDTPIKACNQPEQHSVLIDFVDPQNEKEIVDHYNPEVKLLSEAYPIPDSMQYVITITPQEQPTMQLIRDNGVVYLVAGVSEKMKTGIADPAALAAVFGDEPIIDGDTSAIPETQTLAEGFVIHKK